MTTIEDPPQRPVSLDPSGLRRVLVALCLTEITSWGILYYAFPVLSVAISRDTGWSTSVIVAAFSVSQLVAAVVGIPVGRILDRHGPRWIMTAGSVLAVPALVVIATAHTLPLFFAGWVFAGVAMGAVLYPPAFAALTRWYGDNYVKALMILTLAAGLASTVFAPLSVALADRFDWRTTYLVLAVILAVITIPGHVWGLRGRWPDPIRLPHAQSGDHRRTSRNPAFLALTVALAAGAFAAFAGVFNLVPLLIERGFSPSLAALTLGLGGAGQVIGRIFYLPLAAKTSVRVRTVSVIVVAGLSTAWLGLVSTAAALISIAIGAGLVRGIFTLIQATAITDRWGSEHYGRLNGLMSAPIVIVMALAPWAGTVLSTWTGSYVHAYLVLGAIALVGALISAASIPAIRTTSTTTIPIPS
ncbi:MFS transporter [Rhodococcus sp. ADH]|uniref:MFS transporter n=1 Tax=unclassified Rhodococcus (in: high G+C Gram-positive bacteria) TaxID=192944 RepID=UPI0006BA2A78|nr:MFS transporter [Rhodococcus sp. ADH]KPH21494.1 MFS transporter [Rhodococcus sp. ADH]RGP45500.1 MFS transporter [Rhodococcus erythropolis]